jgi:hypothetical protein
MENTTHDRRALVRGYKDRVIEAGVYAIRCAPTGQVWIGGTPDLAIRQNGVWFALRMGGHPSASLQAAWTEHGELAFGFEVLEVIDDRGLEKIGRAALLVERREHWRAALGAEGLRR